MSGPLAIAAVTAILKDVLNNGLIDQDISSFVGSFNVSAMSPDRISVGETEPNQINLFLYKVTSNQGWSNLGFPSRDGAGIRVSNPPLALDLHYLLSTYGKEDFNAEILLGHAMQIMHETPQISRQDVRQALGGVNAPIGTGLSGTVTPIPSPFGSLSAVDLADQVELIKITPQFLSTEDLSKLWTAMQARYRQSMAYQVSVVLIQSTQAVKTALPVLKRGDQDRGVEALADARSSFPTLESMHIGPVEDATIDPLPRSYPSAQLGLQLILLGENFDGDSVQLSFVHSRFGELTHPQHLPPLVINVPLAQRTAKKIIFSLPADITAMTAWRTGLYRVVVQVTKATKIQTSNELPLVLAPRIDSIAPANPIIRDGSNNATLTLTCAPAAIKEQAITLLLADMEATAEKRVADSDPLVFKLKNAPALADVPVRLRIDGSDSMPFERKFDVSGNPLPLAFANAQKVTLT